MSPGTIAGVGDERTVSWQSSRQPRMGMNRLPHLLLVLLFHAYVLGVSAMRFDMAASETKCFGEELHLDVLVLGTYRVVTENSPRISAKVTSPYGFPLHFQEHVVEGQFGFTSKEIGNFVACFWIPEAPKGTKITVDLDWKTGLAAKDWANVAKREKIDGIELEIRKLEDAVKDIHDNMLYLREREEQMRHVNETTNSRMAWFSISSLFICLVVAVLQLWYLKTFFEKKKLI